MRNVHRIHEGEDNEQSNYYSNHMIEEILDSDWLAALIDAIFESAISLDSTFKADFTSSE